VLRILYVLAFGLVSAWPIFFSHTAVAADVGMNRQYSRGSGLVCHEIERCGPKGCHWYNVCSRPCPDAFSCAPLYGAYGPYGGTGYWAGYTDSGWSSSRQIDR
jgi:hypothetical protein